MARCERDMRRRDGDGRHSWERKRKERDTGTRASSKLLDPGANVT
jgi:hypothetical protein